jgi:hypothetical protein
MYFPKHWARGSHEGTTCWGWSDADEGDARRKAEERARVVAAKVDGSAHRRETLERYPYGRRPLKEKVLEEIRDAGGETHAVLTRNSYGAVVLSTARIPFVDIDVESGAEEPQRGLLAWLRRLFTEPPVDVEAKGPSLDRKLEEIEGWTRAHPEWSFRIYKTYGGLRLLVTSPLVEPKSDRFGQLCRDLGADPIYMRLCQELRSYRARLSPKPWRCGALRPPVEWPFQSKEEEREFERWLEEYRTLGEQFATCGYVTRFGSDEGDSDVRTIVEFHDRKTKVGSELELA